MSRKNRLQKIISGILAFVLCIGVTAVAPCDEASGVEPAVTNDAIEEKLKELGDIQAEIQKHNDEIERMKKENDALESKIMELQGKVQKTQDELKKQKDELDRIEDEIERINEELEAAQEQIKDQEIQMDERIAEMYKSSTFSYWDMILSASSFSDFFYRMKISQQISEDDRAMLEHYCDELDRITEIKQDLLAAEYRQIETIQTIDATVATLNAQIKEHENAVTNLKTNMEKQTEIVLDLESAENAIGKVIQQLVEEEQRRQEEERRRQEEERKRLEEEERRRQEEEERRKKEEEEKEQQEQQVYPYGYMLWPVKDYYYVTAEYGPRAPIPGVTTSNKHCGLDIAGRKDTWYPIKGQPVRAAAAGTVLVASTNSLYGNYVMLDHGGGVVTLYAHGMNNVPMVAAGQKVSAGDTIMLVGDSGPVTGAHLHFEVWENGQNVNPRKYLGYPDKA